MTMMAGVSKEQVDQACKSLSVGGRWHYTTLQLYYELVRRRVLPEPGGEPVQDMECFREALTHWEQKHGDLDLLVRSDWAQRSFDKDRVCPDVLTYAVRRVLFFERPELFLLFATNHFFMRLECLLLSDGQYPEHIFQRVQAQIQQNMSVTFF